MIEVIFFLKSKHDDFILFFKMKKLHRKNWFWDLRFSSMLIIKRKCLKISIEIYYE